jgi:hypothetical protein
MGLKEKGFEGKEGSSPSPPLPADDIPTARDISFGRLNYNLGRKPEGRGIWVRFLVGSRNFHLFSVKIMSGRLPAY